MTYNVIVRPEAEREIQEAFDWYEDQSEGLGTEFLRATDAACPVCNVVQKLIK